MILGGAREFEFLLLSNFLIIVHVLNRLKKICDQQCNGVTI